MNRDEIARIYEELDTALVPLAMPHDTLAAKGIGYFYEKMMEVRRQQDRTSSLAIRVGAELSRLRKRMRALKAAAALSGTSEQGDRIRTELSVVEDELDDVKALSEAVENRRGNLRQTGSDIRLMMAMIESQIKLGEVLPPPRGLESGEEETLHEALAHKDSVPVREVVRLETVDIGDILKVDEHGSPERH